MKFEYFNFPRTPHLLGSPGVSRDDKVLSKDETKKFLNTPVKIQEKVDGNNIAIYSNINENPLFKCRGSNVVLPTIKFKKLDDWHDCHMEEINKICNSRYILSGEWTFWEHQLKYDQLPSFFVAYDIFDLQKEQFLSQKGIKERLQNTSIYQNPVIFEGKIESLDKIKELMEGSSFGAEKKEGLYIRIENDLYTDKRAKYVAPEFIRNIEDHWQPGNPNKSMDPIETHWSYIQK